MLVGDFRIDESRSRRKVDESKIDDSSLYFSNGGNFLCVLFLNF